MPENRPPSEESGEESSPLEQGARTHQGPTGGEAFAVSVSFAELTFAHFLMYKEQREQALLHGPAEAEFERLRESFESSEGLIVKTWWGVNLAVGMALTVKSTAPLPITKYLGLGAGPGTSCRLHRATEGLDLPAEVEAALFDGDLLAVKASGVLHGGSGRIVLERVMGVQTYMLNLIDASRGEIPRPAPAETSWAASEAFSRLARVVAREMHLR